MPVTVIEAGPCPVTAIRDAERDGYAAMQLAGVETEGGRLTKGGARPSEEGRRRPDADAGRVPDDEEHQIGDVITVESFEPGQKVKVSGVSVGKGFQGTIQAATIQPRAGDPRLAQRQGAGLDRRERRPGPRVQGNPDARPDGRAARDPAGARGDRGRHRANLLLVKGAVPGPRNATVEVRSDG